MTDRNVTDRDDTATMNGDIHLFVDFDGTATHHDVGDSIFETFIPRELKDADWHGRIIAEWKAGRRTSYECLREECACTKVTAGELDLHLDAFDLTPGFRETVSFCDGNGIPVTVLSDGLDYYIARILARHGLGHLDVRANHLVIDGDRLEVSFPWMDGGCGRCGNCKRHHIDTLSRDGATRVYAGDGYSDRYAVRSCDMVFARRDLAAYCDMNGIAYRPFDDFFAVLDGLRDLVGVVG